MKVRDGGRCVICRPAVADEGTEMDFFFFDPPRLPPTQFWDVKEHPDCKKLSDMGLSEHQTQSLWLLIIALMHVAGSIEPLNAKGVRYIALEKAIRVSRDVQFDPVGLYYCLSEDGTTALILEAEPIAGDGVVHLSHAGLTATLVAEVRAAIAKVRSNR